MNTQHIELPAPVLAKIRNLATRHRNASGVGITVINALGGQAESWLGRLPGPVRIGLDGATRSALVQASKAAHVSRGAVPDQPGWVNTAVGAAMGAAGGIGGTATALAELPVTVTLLMRIIQGVAAEYDFDPAEESVQFDCLTVFASAGPLDQDDGAETAFISARLALNGAALQKVLAAVSPKLAGALGQKLAAQAVPILGAAAGAAINFAYTGYYREMAHVQFGLRKLSVDTGINEHALLRALQKELTGPDVQS
ncbi:protein EcsC [Aliishimia ponticola]|uniref:Protein EcsC n=1 Tax=Aliishimia ponticola TaxID=2499833 RepID=A0A4S4NCT6_9RHOB|nr:EcsC family protein [Aliishimia ponticola]THH37266.1 protein EcsC [Aliishimia ponticola]